MAKEKDKAASAEGAPKKFKKKLMIIIIAIVVALAGGGGAYLMLSPSEVAAEPPPEPGMVIPLEAITINLSDGHYLKLKLSLQATADVKEELDGSKALDIAIEEFSNRPMAELFSNEERLRAKADLKEKLAEAYEGEVMDVYFTNFVIQ